MAKTTVSSSFELHIPPNGQRITAKQKTCGMEWWVDLSVEVSAKVNARAQERGEITVRPLRAPSGQMAQQRVERSCRRPSANYKIGTEIRTQGN